MIVLSILRNKLGQSRVLEENFIIHFELNQTQRNFLIHDFRCPMLQKDCDVVERRCCLHLSMPFAANKHEIAVAKHLYMPNT